MQFVKRAISVFFKLGVALFLFQACGDPASPDPINTSQKISDQVHVLVLGTAQDAGYPQINCNKECCQQVWSGKRAKESVTCLGVIDPEKNRYWLIDATPSIIDQCRMVEEMYPGIELAGILLTHAHIGHYTGLMMLGREAMGAKDMPTYAMPRMRSFLESNGPWSQLVELNNIELITLKEESPIRLSDELVVTPFLVPHRAEFSETVGFRISGTNQTVLYIPDIDKWDIWEKEINEEIAQVDYAILDGTFYKDGEIPGRDMNEIPHPFIQESMRHFEKLSVANRQKIFFIHFNHTNPLLWSDKQIEQFNLGDYGLAHTGQQFSL